MEKKFRTYAIFLFAGLVIMPVLVAASISQGLITDEVLDGGTIVSLDPSRPDHVVKASTSNIGNLLGVVAGEGGALVSASSEETNVDVITSGEAFIFVSTLNGVLEAGDRITASPVSGVGMKAISRVKAVAIAQESFDGSGDNVQEVTITDAAGEEKSIAIGIARAHISIHEHIPEAESGNPFFVALQDAAQSVTGRPVSLAKTLIASGIMLSSLIVVVMLLMGATQGTMISLGRNPLAKRTIFSTMIKFVSVSILIFIGGIVSAYIILIS